MYKYYIRKTKYSPFVKYRMRQGGKIEMYVWHSDKWCSSVYQSVSELLNAGATEL